MQCAKRSSTPASMQPNYVAPLVCAQFITLKSRLLGIIEPSEDSLRFYFLGRTCRTVAWSWLAVARGRRRGASAMGFESRAFARVATNGVRLRGVERKVLHTFALEPTESM